MSPHRIQLDNAWSPAQLQAHAADPQVRILQFNALIDPGRLDSLAQALDRHVLRARPDITVRAYGFSRAPLDLAFLQHLPHLHLLSVDCCDDVIGEQAIAAMPRLRRLTFDVHGATAFAFLRQLPVSLESLRLGKTGRKGPDLDLLQRYRALQHLSLNGQANGLPQLAGLPQLRSLHLGGMPLSALPFLRQLPQLEHLSLGFGAATNLDDLRDLHRLRTLRLLRVRGLADAYSLASLTALQQLYIDDQPHLTALPVLAGPARLTLVMDNVGLDSLDWIVPSGALCALAMVRMKHITPAQVGALLQAPHSLQRLQVGLSRAGDNRQVEALLQAAGLSGAPGGWHQPDAGEWA